MQGAEKSARVPPAFNLVGLLGVSLWMLTLFLRGTAAIHNPGLQFWLGIAPNFGVGLLLSMLLINCYPVALKLKKALTYRQFLYGLGLIFAVLFLSEVVHALFLGAAFDIFDLLVSLLALGLMAWLHLRLIDKTTRREHDYP